MKDEQRPLLGILAVLALAVMPLPPSFADSPREIAERVLPSVVLVRAEDASGRVVGTGSGFVVGDGLIATNMHVVQNASRAYVRRVGADTQHQVHGIAASDAGYDLVLLSVVGLEAQPLSLGDSGAVAVGDEVYVAGNPLGLEGTFSAGIVSSVRTMGSDSLLQITAPISPGSSGGPVVNASGQVVGIATAFLEGGQNLNFAVPSAYARPLLLAAGEVRPLSGQRQREPDEQSVSDDMWASLAGSERRAAEEGDVTAMFNLGLMYETGRGVVQDDREAMNWYRRAAEDGCADAMLNMGVMYADGRGVTQDAREAVSWYRRAAEKGNAMAMFNLGMMYQTGRGVVQDDREAMNWYRRAAEDGCAVAMFNLGGMYATGRGVAQDGHEAVTWYRRAAEQGSADAMNNLGVMYQTGRGVAQNDREAVNWYRRAAEAGSAAGMRNLGVMYEDGRGAAQDDREAMNWYRRAAEQGDAAAMFNVGCRYAIGQGVVQNDREAMSWIRRAAERGSANAMVGLGMIYEHGVMSTVQDEREAVTWYRRAAEQGDATAMLNLGVMYGDGRGVAQDDSEAYVWFSVAAALGHAEASDLREHVAKRLTNEVRMAAQRRAQALFARLSAVSGK